MVRNKERGARSSKDFYDAELMTDMEAEAAYEAEKKRWKEAPAIAPAPRPKAADKDAPDPVIVDDGTHASLKGALEVDSSKRAAGHAELASLPTTSKEDGYAEMANNLPAVDVSDKQEEDALGNKLPPAPLAKKKATKQDLKKIRKRVETQRAEGQTVDTDEELERYGFFRAPDEAKSDKPKVAASEAGVIDGITETVMNATTGVIDGVGAAASGVINVTANVVETAVSAVSPRADRRGTPAAAAQEPLSVEGGADKKKKKNKDCVVM